MSDWGAGRSLAMEWTPEGYWGTKHYTAPRLAWLTKTTPARRSTRGTSRPGFDRLRSPLGFQQERHRTVVDQTDHHMGAEPPGFHPGRVLLPARCQQPVEDGFSQFRRGRGGEAGAHPAAGVRGQGELADQQQPAAGVGDAEVHPPLPVIEDAVAEQAFGHARD